MAKRVTCQFRVHPGVLSHTSVAFGHQVADGQDQSVGIDDDPRWPVRCDPKIPAVNASSGTSARSLDDRSTDAFEDRALDIALTVARPGLGCHAPVWDVTPPCGGTAPRGPRKDGAGRAVPAQAGNNRPPGGFR